MAAFCGTARDFDGTAALFCGRLAGAVLRGAGLVFAPAVRLGVVILAFAGLRAGATALAFFVVLLFAVVVRLDFVALRTGAFSPPERFTIGFGDPALLASERLLAGDDVEE